MKIVTTHGNAETAGVSRKPGASNRGTLQFSSSTAYVKCGCGASGLVEDADPATLGEDVFAIGAALQGACRYPLECRVFAEFVAVYNLLLPAHLEPATEGVSPWREVLYRDPCVYCGGRATAIDHIVPRARGGEDAVGNLASACRSCNSQKHATPLLHFLLARA